MFRKVQPEGIVASGHLSQARSSAREDDYEVGQDGSQPKFNGQAMHDFIAAAIDPKDGGLMFYWAKRGTWPRNQLCALCQCKPCDCNGMLPCVKTCSEFISSETQKKKKKAKKTVDLQSADGGAKSGE